jgi:hypothetical protein
MTDQGISSYRSLRLCLDLLMRGSYELICQFYLTIVLEMTPQFCPARRTTCVGALIQQLLLLTAPTCVMIML